MRKHRGDAVLKNLGDGLKEQTYQYLRFHTQKATVVWLREKHGVETNTAALTHFFDWYSRQGWLKQTATIADQIGEQASKIEALRDKAKVVGEIAQVSFEVMAAQNRDPQFYLDLQRERRDERRLQLERDKHEWSKKSDVERGLDALQEEIGARPRALKLFAELKAELAKPVEAVIS